MEELIYKPIVKYYSHLKIVTDTWNDVIVSVEQIIKGLKCLYEQFHHLTSADADQTEIYKQEGLKEKLILKAFRAIQNEITLLGNFLNRLNSINQVLKNKFLRIEEVRGDVSLRDSGMEQLVNGTPLVPRLKNLLIWAKDLQDYYQSLFRNVNENFNSLYYINEESIVKFEKSIHINYSWRIQIDRILRLTETLSKTNVS